MPELPEVEVTRLSLLPVLLDQPIERVVVRETRFRKPVPSARMKRTLPGQVVSALRRRSKYLLIDLKGRPKQVGQTLIIHLGMSGRLRYLEREATQEPHEHVVLQLANGHDVRFRDPRRFGLVLLEPTDDLDQGALLAHLGPEPLEPIFPANFNLTAGTLNGKFRSQSI